MSKKQKTLVNWIRGFALEEDKEQYAINWSKEASDILTSQEIKKAIEEMVNYNTFG